MDYEFTTNRISQHIIKYGLDLRPPLTLQTHRQPLQDYCNWLIERFGGLYETLLSGPNQLNLQKTFPLPNGKNMQFPTFVLSPRGPVFGFPQRVFVDQVHNLQLDDSTAVVQEALAELKSRFLEQKLARFGVVNELVFDTAEINSTDLVAANLNKELWRSSVRNLNLHLEMPAGDKNLILQIKPTFVQKAGPARQPVSGPYGIIVVVDINNRQISKDLGSDQIQDIMDYARRYVPEELIKFLNNEC